MAAKIPFFAAPGHFPGRGPFLLYCAGEALLGKDCEGKIIWEGLLGEEGLIGRNFNYREGLMRISMLSVSMLSV